MTRKTKALSGASQDAYFRRVLKDCQGLSEPERERVVGRLRQEVAHLRIRTAAPDAPGASPQMPAPIADARLLPHDPLPGADAAAAPVAVFDPFALNVIVVLRTAGKDAALAALNAIADAAHLKLLAREQRLSIGDDLETPAALSAAIVAAAERRVANRRAAAGVRSQSEPAKTA